MMWPSYSRSAAVNFIIFISHFQFLYFPTKEFICVHWPFQWPLISFQRLDFWQVLYSILYFFILLLFSRSGHWGTPAVLGPSHSSLTCNRDNKFYNISPSLHFRKQWLSSRMIWMTQIFRLVHPVFIDTVHCDQNQSGGKKNNDISELNKDFQSAVESKSWRVTSERGSVFCLVYTFYVSMFLWNTDPKRTVQITRGESVFLTDIYITLMGWSFSRVFPLSVLSISEKGHLSSPLSEMCFTGKHDVGSMWLQLKPKN